MRGCPTAWPTALNAPWPDGVKSDRASLMNRALPDPAVAIEPATVADPRGLKVADPVAVRLAAARRAP